MKKMNFLWGTLFFLVVSVIPVQAAETLKEFLLEGTPYIDARYRYEFVDQDGAAITADANASTLRTRLGYKTGTFYDFSGVFELENVLEVGNDDYNNTINRRADHPVVADVENTEINQVFLTYKGLADTALNVGRQRIVVDDHRFIGDVGWRQGNQTFDGVTLTNKSIEDVVAKYGYIGNVNRIFGDDPAAGDWESNSHFYNVSYAGLPFGKLTTYGYLLDFQGESPGNSSQTYGVSLTGKQALNDEITLKYYGEYAYQMDHADNITDYGANYYRVAPALAWKGLTTTIGYEVLGSDNNKGFSTPLATGHKFNGWADKFLGTPAKGLEDFYVDVTYKLSGLEGNFDFLNGLLTKVQYHDFNADKGGADYGSEWGFFAQKSINKNVYVQAKYANYNADTFATDTKKFTFGVGVKY
ncbi:hypothetical protein MNBD_UNCLBAC01-1699 [hydrothermal vent metagenome]|uniref:Alginate export domain-containing protein n=1 Tax=hydrothermal vent metagenome TaxID=652676 RepID=A0A3B1D8T4_9ZZZZ